MSKRRQVSLWVLTALLAAMFLFAGGLKLADPAKAGGMFQHYGYPPWFALVTGAMEVTGALLLLVPPVAWAGAVLVGIVAIGATATHLTHAEASHAPVPLVLLVIAAVVFYLRREGLLRLLGRSPAARGQLAGKRV